MRPMRNDRSLQPTQYQGGWGGGGEKDTILLGHTMDVRPEWVSFRGQKPTNWCKFLP